MEKSIPFYDAPHGATHLDARDINKTAYLKFVDAGICRGYWLCWIKTPYGDGGWFKLDLQTQVELDLVRPQFVDIKKARSI